MGTYACVGKNLALMEIRNVIVNVVKRFDIRLASPKMREDFVGGRQDGRMLRVGKLDLVFDGRKP